jgi:RNase adaptor protein for sRNA GlmZ degradation
LGSYGKISIKGDKKQFLVSIPKALGNLKKVLQVLETDYNFSFPNLSVLVNIPLSFPSLLQDIPLELISFSYASNQIPILHPHCINLVFDARMFQNPGRDPDLKLLTGKDNLIQRYVAQSPEFNKFIESILETIHAIRSSTYDYSAPITDIRIHIGCTGGRHRSVAAVELILKKMTMITNCKISAQHLNL